MTTLIVHCPNAACGRVSHLGVDPLGRIFRCPRCLTKLPQRRQQPPIHGGQRCWPPARSLETWVSDQCPPGDGTTHYPRGRELSVAEFDGF